MPNRILKESICSSESIDGLTLFEEVFFYRLIVQCDEYGRMDARVPMLRARLFPLKEDVTASQVQSALKRLAELDMVRVYEENGRPYLSLPSWERHQNVRARRSKYPAPPWAKESGKDARDEGEQPDEQELERLRSMTEEMKAQSRAAAQ